MSPYLIITLPKILWARGCPAQHSTSWTKGPVVRLNAHLDWNFARHRSRMPTPWMWGSASVKTSQRLDPMRGMS